MKSKKLKKYFISLFFLVFLDQVSKFLAIKFNLPILYNKKGFLGLLGKLNWLQNLACFSLILLIIYWFKMEKEVAGWKELSFLLLIAGGISNQIDKFFRGAVIDFINIKIWPVFNLADLFVTSAVIIILAYNIL